MTLLVAISGESSLVLAADSRGTFGDPRGVTAQNDTMQKASVLCRHAAALVAGSGEVGSLLIREVTQLVAEQQIDGVTPVTNYMRGHVRMRYDEWFPTVMAMPPLGLLQSGQAAARPELALIVAGYETDGGPASIY